MNRIEYEIKLNENGRPCIDLPKGNGDKPEDKFYAMEIARYLIQSVYNRRSAEFDQDTAEKINIAITVMGQIGDEMAELLFNSMKSAGDMSLLFNNTFNLKVETLEALNELSSGNYILHNDKIFDKKAGLKALVTYQDAVYELQENEENVLNWVELV